MGVSPEALAGIGARDMVDVVAGIVSMLELLWLNHLYLDRCW